MSQIPTPSSRLILHLTVAILVAALAHAPAAIAQSPVPTFSKSFSPSTIGPGSTSTLSFVITNGTGAGLRDLAFTDNLPAGVTIAGPPAVTNSCLGSVSATGGGSTITFSGGQLRAGDSCTITVNVTSSTVGTHTNTTGDLTSDAGNSGPATADLIVATDRPGFTKSFSPASVFFGGRSTLTFTIDNTANGSSVTELSFTDTLPSGMVIASPANRVKTCIGGTFTAPAGGSTISYDPFSSPSSLAAGASCTLRVDVVGNATGQLGNTSGELTSRVGTNTRSSGKASAVLTVSASVEQIALEKQFTDDPVPPGGSVTLEFTVRNLNRETTATDISFTDDLDAALSGLEATDLPSEPCGAGSSITGTSLLTFSGGEVAPEAVCTFSVTLAVPAGAAVGSYVNTTSAITADFGGSPATGDPASDTLFVEPVPLLTKTFIGDPVGAGGSLDLEFTITNTSTTSDATDITFEDVFVDELPTASFVPADGFCGPGSTADYTPLAGPTPATLVVSGASLGPGESCTFSLTLGVAVGAATNTYDNTTSEITATIDGETFIGNPASDSFDMVAAPVLLKEFTDDPAEAGGTVTLEFTLVHDEDAPGAASGITFSDDLDATLSGLVATGVPATDVCGTGSQIDGTMTLLFTGGSLAPGESCTFSVTLAVPASAAPGRYPNTTSNVVATVLSVSTQEDPATDTLRIAGLSLTKSFTDDPAIPGGSVTLEFTLSNAGSSPTASSITFSDNLDATLTGLAGDGVPLSDVCGPGNGSVSWSAGNTNLTFSGGTLAAGETCTFSVVLDVPAGAVPDTYTNVTSAVSATVGGVPNTIFDNAFDELTVVADFLALSKEFLDDPVGPGDNVTLRFTVLNLSDTETVADISFTDDLDAALSGLEANGLPATDVCGTGSEIDGLGFLTFTGGTLGPGASCFFDVILTVPGTAELGTVATNVTSQVTGSVEGLTVTGDPASDDLQIDALVFVKSFEDVGIAGGTVVLTFTIQNLSSGETEEQLGFTDDLDDVIIGLAAIDTPQLDVCGEGSVLSGTSFLALTGASLLPGGSCTFSVTLQIPAAAAPGDYVNVTSALQQVGLAVAEPATDTLTVIEVADSDGDGVLDSVDVCPGTVIPEGVPTVRLGVNRYALVDEDFVFDTTPPHGNGGGDDSDSDSGSDSDSDSGSDSGDSDSDSDGNVRVFTLEDTGGCSCEQIIEIQGLGEGHTKFGCSLGAMREWVEFLDMVFNGLLFDGFESGDLGAWKFVDPSD